MSRAQFDPISIPVRETTALFKAKTIQGRDALSYYLSSGCQGRLRKYSPQLSETEVVQKSLMLRLPLAQRTKLPNQIKRTSARPAKLPR